MKKTWSEDQQGIVSFYSGLIEDHGVSPSALDWGSEQSQELRFSVFNEIASLESQKVVDIGCGLGDFYIYLNKTCKKIDYTGYDITEIMISKARERLPGCDFRNHDILGESTNSREFDYVFASGIFYKRSIQPMEFMEWSVRRMFQLCRKGVAFNSLSSLAKTQGKDEFHAHPSRVFEMCMEISPNVVLRHDYLNHDFTVYLYRNAR